MTPVFQDRFGKGNGNCLQAAVASVLDLPLDAIPNFSDAEGDWFVHITRWASEQGIGVIYAPTKGEQFYLAVNSYAVGVWSIGDSEERHAVVMRFDSSQIDGDRWQWEADVVHNPNPATTQLLSEFEEVLFFIPRGINPLNYA